MKKYLSLLLAFTMMISSLAVLTACGDNETPDPNTPPETPVDRYTVTEEEWLANMESYNYTLNFKYLNNLEYDGVVDFFTERITSYSTVDSVKTIQERQGFGFNDSITYFQIKNGDTYFSIYENLYNNSYEAIETENNNSMWLDIGRLPSSYGIEVDINGGFSEFYYDESSKAYIYTFDETIEYDDFTEITMIYASISFLNGRISKMYVERIRESNVYSEEFLEFTFTNVGNTTIDIPSYTLVEQ